jgi:large subunit ribosomal protein L4
VSTTVKVHTPAGKTDGSVELPAEVFDVQANVPLMHQVVVAQLAAARQGTHSTKTRGEVAGGGRKPYRQKGTGRARQGSIRAPQFAGGGVVHGPQPRDYSQRTPKKMKAAALRGALSDRARAGRVHVVSELVAGGTPSTKTARKVIESLSSRARLLVVVAREDEAGWKSLRNVPSVHLIAPDQLNTYDVLVSDDVVFTRGALDAFLSGPSRGRSARASARSGEAEVQSLVDGADDTDGVDQHPYGPDSHGPIADDAQPDGFPVKGNANSMLYHVPGSSFYNRTVAEVWFTSAEAAEAAGFQLPPSQREKEDGQ